MNWDDMYALCNSKRWFTAGTNEQYDKLRVLCNSGVSAHDLALAIWLCTSGVSLGDIERILMDYVKRNGNVQRTFYQKVLVDDSLKGKFILAVKPLISYLTECNFSGKCSITDTIAGVRFSTDYGYLIMCEGSKSLSITESGMSGIAYAISDKFYSSVISAKVYDLLANISRIADFPIYSIHFNIGCIQEVSINRSQISPNEYDLYLK